MNLRRLEYFLAIVETGTMTAAAERLHVAQPALSRQVRTLERELRMRLFAPRGNRLALTPSGRAFVEVARRLQQADRDACSAVEALREGRVESLTVAATVTTIRGVLAPFIAGIGADDPVLITRETRHFAVYDALRHGADLAVSPAPPEPGFARMAIGPFAIRASVAPDHPWARQGRTEVGLSELSGQDVLLPTHGSVSRHIVDAALSTAEVLPRRIRECDDGSTLIALARAGRGVAVTSEMTGFGAHSLQIRTDGPGQDGTPLRLPMQVAWEPDHYAADTLRHIALQLREFARGRAAAG